MSSDADYQAFLDKANQDVSGGDKVSTSQSAGTQAINTEVPKALEGVEEYFVSEADEPFEPVSLSYSGSGLLSEDDFAKLLQTEYPVVSIKQEDVDPRGQYSKVVNAVKAAAKGELAFFRIQLSDTRVEYYIVTVDEKARRVVGLKAKAVES